MLDVALAAPDMWSPRMLVVYADSVDSSRAEVAVTVHLEVLINSAKRAADAYPHIVQLQGHGFDLRIRAGVVLGFAENLQRRCHRQILPVFQDLWVQLRGSKLLTSDDWDLPIVGS